MKKIFIIPMLFLLAIAVMLTACGGAGEVTPTLPPAPTSTPDPCAPENIAIEVARVNALMREFDDGSQLASQTPHDQLVNVIPSLQDVRRRAEDLEVPYCLATLKALQVTHMNTVINTLLAFLSDPQSEIVMQGIAQARLQHEDYNRELARLIGATYAPAAAATAATPSGTEGTPAVTSSAAPALVTNSGTTPINLRSSPDVNAASPGQLDAGASAAALGKTSDGLWIQIVSPFDAAQTVWVYAQLVTLTGGDSLPVVTPTP